MINEFKYGQTWKIWPSQLSLSLYSTFNLLQLIQYSFNSQYCLRKLNEKCRKTGVYMHLYLPYKNSNSSVEYQFIKQKQLVHNHSIESYLIIYHSASFFSLVINYNKEKQVIQIRNIQSTKHVSITMKKISYSRYKIGINYN